MLRPSAKQTCTDMEPYARFGPLRARGFHCFCIGLSLVESGYKIRAVLIRHHLIPTSHSPVWVHSWFGAKQIQALSAQIHFYRTKYCQHATLSTFDSCAHSIQIRTDLPKSSVHAIEAKFWEVLIGEVILKTWHFTQRSVPCCINVIQGDRDLFVQTCCLKVQS